MAQAGMGVAAADYDHDGWLDILKTNFSDEGVDLFHNDGDAYFTNVTGAAGLGLRNPSRMLGMRFLRSG